MTVFVLLFLALSSVAGFTLLALGIMALFNGLEGVTPIGTMCAGSMLIGSSAVLFHLIHDNRKKQWRGK